MSQEKSSRGSSSFGRMLAVLNLFTEERLEWTSEQMMDELGYSRPTLYRYLKTLRENGFIVSLNGAVFALGPKVVEMDYLMHRSDPLVLHGADVLKKLTQDHEGVAFIARWYRSKILSIESARSSATMQSSYARGRPMPIGRGAASRGILAFLPARQAEAIVRANLDEFREVAFGQTVEEVMARMREIRKAGVAIAAGEVTQEILGIAAPIYDAARTPVASLSIAVLQSATSQKKQEQIVADVRGGAQMLSEILAGLHAHNI